MFVLLLILLSSLVSATNISSGITSYYKLDTSNTTQPDELDTYDGTVSGATYTASGEINGSYSFDGVNDVMTIPIQQTWWIGGSRTINLWIKTTQTTTDSIFGHQGDTSYDDGVNHVIFAGNSGAGDNEAGKLKITCRSTYPSDNKHLVAYTTSATDYNDGDWHMITTVITASTHIVKIYVDGDSKSLTYVKEEVMTSFDDTANLGFGASNGEHAGTTEPIDAELDEIGMWEKELNQTEITDLYNAGSGFQYPFNYSAPIQNFKVTASNNYGESINSFNITIDGATYTTTNGTVVTSLFTNASSLYDIDFTSDDYFNKSVSNINISSNYAFTGLFQTQVNFMAVELTSNNLISNFTMGDENGTLSNTTTSGTSTLFLKAGTNIVINFTSVEGYYNFTDTLTLTPKSITNYNLTGVHNAKITILGYNYTVSGAVVSLPNITGGINYSNTSFSTSFVSPNNSIIVNATSNIPCSIYLTSRPDFTISHNTNFKNYTPVKGSNTINFTLFQDESLFFSASDIISGASLDNYNLSLSGSSTYLYDNYTGTSFFRALSPDSYALIVKKDGYATYLDSAVVIVDGFLTNISALMSNVLNEVVIKVEDATGRAIELALVRITRQSDGALVSSTYTDGFGEVEITANDLINYYINVTYLGYDEWYKTFNPTGNSYTVVLEPTISRIDYSNGITGFIRPIDNVPLLNDTFYNFSFSFNSTTWEVTDCWFEIYNGSNLLTSNSSYCNASTGVVYNSFNTSDYNNIKVLATLRINDTANITFFEYYTITNFFKGDFSLMVFFEDVSSFSGSGFNNFTRFLIAIIVIIGVLTMSVGQLNIVGGKGTKTMVLLTALVGVFSFIGWLTIPNIPYNAGQWILFILTGVTTLVVVIMGKVK